MNEYYPRPFEAPSVSNRSVISSELK